MYKTTRKSRRGSRERVVAVYVKMFIYNEKKTLKSLFLMLNWSGRQDLNLRPLRPKRSALPS